MGHGRARVNRWEAETLTPQAPQPSRGSAGLWWWALSISFRLGDRVLRSEDRFLQRVVGVEQLAGRHELRIGEERVAVGRGGRGEHELAAGGRALDGTEPVPE